MRVNSVCCGKRAVTLYLRAHDSNDGPHIDAIVDLLMETVSAPDRQTNPLLDADNEAMFRKRLQLASRGRLHPIEHIKTLARTVPPLSLFELRWTDVRVIPVDPVSGLNGDATSIHVRMYHAEERSSPWIVALHAHHKLIGADEETSDAQNQEIDVAVRLAQEGRLECWGIAELRART